MGSVCGTCHTKKRTEDGGMRLLMEWGETGSASSWSTDKPSCERHGQPSTKDYFWLDSFFPPARRAPALPISRMSLTHRPPARVPHIKPRSSVRTRRRASTCGAFPSSARTAHATSPSSLSPSSSGFRPISCCAHHVHTSYAVHQDALSLQCPNPSLTPRLPHVLRIYSSAHT